MAFERFAALFVLVGCTSAAPEIGDAAHDAGSDAAPGDDGGPPSGCAITATPPSLPAGGGNVVLALGCTAGAPTSQTWSGGFAAGMTTPSVSGLVTTTTVFSAIARNGFGAATPATVTVQVGSPMDLCTAFTKTITFNLAFGGASVVTTQLGAFDDTTALVGKIDVPMNAPTSTSPGFIAVAEYQGPATSRVATISPQPCDFRDMEPFPPPKDPTGAAHPMQWSFGNTASVSFVVGAATTSAAGLTPGKTYYFNVRNYSPDTKSASCGQATCNAIVNLMKSTP